MIFLSFDIASRSLAFTLMNYNVNFLSEVEKLAKSSDSRLVDMVCLLNSSLVIRLCDVVDLNQGRTNKEITQLEKTKKLKEVLTVLTILLCEFKTANPYEEIKVLLEYQMSANYQANAVFNQIFYHFIDFSPITISPCYKNKVFFSEELEYKHFSNKYSTSYAANKAHTKANFLYFLETFNMSHSVQHIKKKNIDDAADSFMQVFAYVNYYLKKNQN